MTIHLESPVVTDEYIDYIKETFDLSVTDTASVDIPCRIHLDKMGDWNIGVICGASGTGKSTILRHLGNVSKVEFDPDKALISNFTGMTPEEASRLLSAMGLASVPAWTRPYRVLSNGEQYRAMMAKTIADAADGEVVFIDEYTSVVDRNVAKSMSNALQKYVRREGRKVVLATCHYDILEWLMPDWTYDLNKGGVLERGDYLRRGRPRIQLSVYRTTSDTWDLFKKHHYMTAEMNATAMCFCFAWNGQLVAFLSCIPNPFKGVSNAYRGSRLVVLPDYQGFGIGSKVSEFIAGVFKAEGYVYYTKTVNPRLGEYRNESPNWAPTCFNGKSRTASTTEKYKNYLTRKSYNHKYVGPAVEGCGELLKKIDVLRREKSLEGQMSFDFEF